jgi:hypothetical protein
MKTFFLAAALALSPFAAAADTVSFNVQCWSEGNNFRVNGSPRSDYLSSTRLFLDLADQSDKKLLKRLFGHVSGQKFVGGAPVITEVDFYSQLNGADILSSLSPRARVYTDDLFWRFNDVKDAISTTQDGGSLWGTLVISKALDNDASRNGGRFAGHLIFQHGDHTGGTMDLTCSRY